MARGGRLTSHDKMLGSQRKNNGPFSKGFGGGGCLPSPRPCATLVDLPNVCKVLWFSSNKTYQNNVFFRFLNVFGRSRYIYIYVYIIYTVYIIYPIGSMYGIFTYMLHVP